ncbi:hypothetical protein FCK90_14405 [Kocuria coralli]|uniref:Transposase n=1 Tax=Kocuria coralli TaxID=1461025 RepID=A0A5J5KTB7_9MICC|nr:DUF6262 family protein [Kocuria coralli]KAA9393017.1 hypothetical protein FCK90_14405 [Kocuria coralli]
MNETSGAEQRAQALRAAAKRRTENAEKAAEHGIRVLIKDGGQITFAAVARASGVSTKFLHQHPDLSQQINQLRTQQTQAAEATWEIHATGESAIIAALRNQLRTQQERHRQETRELRARLSEKETQLAILYGRLEK